MRTDIFGKRGFFDKVEQSGFLVAAETGPLKNLIIARSEACLVAHHECHITRKGNLECFRLRVNYGGGHDIPNVLAKNLRRRLVRDSMTYDHDQSLLALPSKFY